MQMEKMIDFIDCWNDHFYRLHYRGFQKEKLGQNYHFIFMTALEDFQCNGQQVGAIKWKRKN